MSSDNVHKYLVLLCLIGGATFVVVFSVWQGQYNLDPHHWGLQLSNAMELKLGRIPYFEVFVQYGILTTVFNYLFVSLLGGSNLSLILGTSILYSAGLIGVFFLTRELFGRTSIALLAYFSNVLIHPLAIYPWSNYMAYPFIVFGLLLIIKGERSAIIGFLGGVLFGMAVLVRENLFMALFPVLILIFPICFFYDRDKFQLRTAIAPLIGGLVTLIIFFIYLWSNGLLEYWRITSFELPALYSNNLLAGGIFAAIIRLLHYLSMSVHGLIFLAGCFFWVVAAFGIQRFKGWSTPSILIVALCACLLFSSALVLTEVFRLATGAFLGIGLVFGLLFRFLPYVLFWPASAIVLSLCFPLASAGNYFYPTDEKIEVGVLADDLPVFHGHRWPSSVYEYYHWYKNTMDNLAIRSCGVEYLRNETFDMFLAVLAPFEVYQIAPAGLGMHGLNMNIWERSLRPDLDIEERIRRGEVVIVAQDGQEGSLLPDNYRLLSNRLSPPSHFNYWNTDTVIFAPVRCFD